MESIEFNRASLPAALHAASDSGYNRLVSWEDLTTDL